MNLGGQFLSNVGKMKKCLLIILILSPSLNAQDLGITFGGATSSSLFLDLFYKKNSDSFHIGFSGELSDTKGELVSEQKPNYGRTENGSGTYFFTIDLTYGYHFKNRVSTYAELSIGSDNDYTNYIDGRFKEGGYYLITNREPILGIGGYVGYSFTENIGGIVGFNTIRKASFGIQFSYPILKML